MSSLWVPPALLCEVTDGSFKDVGPLGITFSVAGCPWRGWHGQAGRLQQRLWAKQLGSSCVKVEIGLEGNRKWDQQF